MTTPAPRTNPAEPEHIAISKSRGVKIDWTDGHHSNYSLALLRDMCPCATCTGAHGTTPQPSNYSSVDTAHNAAGRGHSLAESGAPRAVRSGGDGPKEMFPMFKASLRMTQVEEMGRYAIRIVWSDGHSTGIYSYDHLRAICPCEACRAQAKDSTAG